MDARIDAMFQELGRQRNSALDLCINLRGEIAALNEESARVKAELDRLKNSPPLGNVTKINALDTAQGT